MSHKKPLILSDINGHQDFRCNDGVLFFDLNESDDEIADKIISFVTSDLDSKGEIVFDNFKKNFSAEEMINKLYNLYLRI